MSSLLCLQLGRHGVAGEVYLQREYPGFVLAGAHEATLRDINGGIRCPGADGQEPPGYHFSGPIQLEDCAHLANQQKYVVGFRWGANSGLDQDAYRRHTSVERRGAAIPLWELFSNRSSGPKGEGFVCVLYMIDPATQDLPKIDVDVLMDAFRVKVDKLADATDDSSGSPRHRGDLPSEQHTRRGTKRNKAAEVVVAPTMHAGVEVCSQRYSVVRFLQGSDDSLWFCYRPATNSAACQENYKTFQEQSLLITIACLAFLLGASCVLQQGQQFMVCVEWIAKFLLDQCLAFGVCIFLVYYGLDADKKVFWTYSISMTVVSTQIVHLSYAGMKYGMSDSMPVFSTFCVLVVIYSPSLFVDALSYYRPLPLLFMFFPRVVGGFAFLIEAARVMLWSYVVGEPEVTDPYASGEESSRSTWNSFSRSRATNVNYEAMPLSKAFELNTPFSARSETTYPAYPARAVSGRTRPLDGIYP